MLRLRIEPPEGFDEETQKFVKPDCPPTTLQLEHSLISLSRWESKWQKPFLDVRQERTEEETLDYIRCMTINKNVDPNIYKYLNADHIRQINEYISSPMTATTINENGGRKVGGKREIITSEIIYSWMISFNVYKECEQWHLNRLLTLINVLSIQTGPKKKMSKTEQAMLSRELNAKRRAMFNTKG